MRVLVCGGRNYADESNLFSFMDDAHKVFQIDVVISGAAKGADSLAEKWGKSRGIVVKSYPADWDKHGRAAGPIRNKLMLDDGKPDLVIAFEGGAGTANMMRQARARNVRVIEATSAKPSAD